MEFTLIDRIVELNPGTSIKATKHLSADEEYLQDHFPRYPVMPGVLMLEALVQTGAWLVRVTNNFSETMILLKEARNVKYAKFLEPGQTLTTEVKILKNERRQHKLQGVGSVNGQAIVSARFTVRCFNLAEIDERLRLNDEMILEDMRKKFALLGGEDLRGVS